MKRLFLALIITVTLATSAFAQFQRVRDSRSGRNLPTWDAFETSNWDKPVPWDPWILFKDQAWFIAKSELWGTSIFKTDGTPGGTSLAIDVSPGSYGPAVVKGLTATSTKLFFLVSDSLTSDTSLKLYVSDGTTASIKRLSDVEVLYTEEANMVALGGNVFFTARDSHGYELWTSDGTVQGTRMVKDINPGSASGTDIPLILHATGGNVYFSANDLVHGYRLWKSDGTVTNTSMVANISLPNGDPLFASIGSTLYFASWGRGLYKTDGTAAGTVLVRAETNPITATRVWGNLVFFSKANEVFRTDGTTAGTFSLGSGFGGADVITAGVDFKNNFYSMAPSILWKTDGTVAGTQSKTVSGQFLGIGANSKAIIMIERSGTNQSFEPILWTWDGVAPAFTKVFPGYSWTQSVLTVPGKLQHIKTFKDQFILAYMANNKCLEPWTTDGTPGSMTLLMDIFRGTWNEYEPFDLVSVGSKVFFAAQEGPSELWVSDGTEAGTHGVKDFVPFPEFDFVSSVRPLNGVAILNAGGGFWRSDGTEAGTVKIGNTPVYGGVVMGNYLYHGSGDYLVRTNGTPGGTTVVKSQLTGGSGNLQDFGRLGESSFFFKDGNGGFWVSDGTEAGTVKLNAPGAIPYERTLTFPAGKNTFFITGEFNNWQLAKTDGTAEGTMIPKVLPDRNGYRGGLYDLTIHCTLDTVAIFSAKTSASGIELWRSDGTTDGTFMVKDILPGSGNSDIAPIYNTDSLLYFTAKTSANETAMWKTNGTPSGTEMLFVLPRGFKVGCEDKYARGQGEGKLFNGQVLFPATSYETGLEIWRTNFTEEGTFPLGEILPGPNSALITETVVTTADYFFIARDETHGRNLYKLDHNYTFKEDQTITFEPIETKAMGVAPFGLTATASSGLNVQFEIISGPATITDTTLTITGVGTVVVKAIQAGDNTYYPAFKRQSFIVVPFQKKDQTIDFPLIGAKQLSDPPFHLTATASSGLAVQFDIVSGPATISGNTVTLTGTGTVVVIALQMGDDAYNPASKTQSFNVGESTNIKQTQTIDFTSIGNKKTSDLPFELKATATSNLPVQFEVFSGPAVISGDKLTVTGAGTVVVFAIQAGNDQYYGAFAEQSFMVEAVGGKQNQIIEFAPIGTKHLAHPPFALTATASSGLPVTFKVESGPATISGFLLTITSTGVVTVSATQAGNENYNPAVEEQSFIVELVLGVEPESYGISFHPNPATSTIVVNLPSSPSFKAIALKDVLGRDVLNMDIVQQQVSLDVEKFPRGIYIVQLIGDDRFVYSKRIILK